MIVVSFLTAAAVAAAPQAPAFPIGADRVMRSASLGELLAATAPAVLPPFSTMLGAGAEGENPYASLLDEGSAWLTPEFVVEVLRSDLTRRDEATAELTELRVVGSRLVVAGPANGADLVVRALRAIEAEVMRPVEITARLYAGTDAPGPVVLPPGVDPGQNPIWEAKATTRSGVATSLVQRRLAKYVRDADVEVAQEQDIADPIIATLVEGITVRVEAHALAGTDELLLFCHAAVGELHEPMSVRSTGVNGMVTLDVPIIEHSGATFAGRVANGGSLVLYFGGMPEAGATFTLSISASSAAGAADPRRLEGLDMLPCSALTTRSLLDPVTTASNDEAEADQDRMLPLKRGSARDEGATLMQVDSLVELLVHVVEQEYQEGRVTVACHGGWVFASGDADARRRLRDAIVSLQQQWLRIGRCELTTQLRGMTDAGDVFGHPQADGAPRVLHQIVAPICFARAHYFIRGLESTTIDDQAVEIAQEASAVNPVVWSTFAGVLANVAAYESGDGAGTTATIDVSTQAPAEHRSNGSRRGGDLFLSRNGRAQLTHRGRADGAQAVVLGDAGIVSFGKTRGLAQQTLRVTAQ